ncbi:hypothetical protein CAEBREN_05891 [Caenorhabditis brenneri]|uniref:Sdz-33 F-box domain-containing protein n=1 Tax=Caenorhabditis brenneri TaxID=135651 RepID=G0NX03_CAEBE|nr:hypothetical protein CAEBREN_05891 [Caenorhabditis brenneri]
MSSFPLFRLPSNVLMTAIRSMEPLHQLTLSTCSIVANNLVKTAGLRCHSLYIEHDGDFKIVAKFNERRTVTMTILYIPSEYNDDDDDYDEDDDEEVRPLRAKVEAKYNLYEGEEEDDTKYLWRHPTFTLKDWVKNLMGVLNRGGICGVYCGPRNYLNYVRPAIKDYDLKYLKLRNDRFYYNQVYGEEILESVSTVSRFEYMGHFKPSEFSKLLISNLDVLIPSEDQDITLNDLLLCNAAHFNSNNSNLTPENLNKFLKLWMKGSNTRLRYLKVGYESFGDLDEELILDGINYQDQMKSKVFTSYCREHTDHAPNVMVEGGYNVYRKDGTKATIIIDRLEDFTFELFVWSDE